MKGLIILIFFVSLMFSCVDPQIKIKFKTDIETATATPTATATATPTATHIDCRTGFSEACSLNGGIGIDTKVCTNGVLTSRSGCVLNKCNNPDNIIHANSCVGCIPGSEKEKSCATNIAHSTESKIISTCKLIDGEYSYVDSSCHASGCASGYTLSSDKTVCSPVACVGLPTIACTANGGKGTRTRSCVLGAWVNATTCSLTSCDNSNHEIINNICVYKACAGSGSVSCSGNGGSGERVGTCVNGSWQYSNICKLNKCDTPNNVIQNNICIANSGSDLTKIADSSVLSNFNQLTTAQLVNIIGEFNVYYPHTSHGSQLISGMKNIGGISLTNFDAFVEAGFDLGSSSWDTNVRNYLDGHPLVNLVTASWCGQLSSASLNVQTHYINKMAKLEQDFPNVTFIYQTGHPRGAEYSYSCTESNTAYTNNQLIRNYAKNNNKYLFDFDELDSHILQNNTQVSCEQNCTTSTFKKNYPQECTWGTSAYSCSHSKSPNCDRKGRAFLILLALISGHRF